MRIVLFVAALPLSLVIPSCQPAPAESKPEKVLTHDYGVDVVMFGPDDNLWCFASEGKSWRWSVADWKPLPSEKYPFILSVQWLRKTSELVISTFSDLIETPGVKSHAPPEKKVSLVAYGIRKSGSQRLGQFPFEGPIAISDDGNYVSWFEEEQGSPRIIVANKVSNMLRSTRIEFAPGTDVDDLYYDSEFEPNGNLVAIAGFDVRQTSVHDDSFIAILDRDSLDLQRSLRFRETISRIGFSPDGKYLAVLFRRGAITLYDTDTWKGAKTIETSRSIVSDFAFDLRGLILAVSFDRDVQVFDTTTWKRVAQFTPTHSTHCISVSNDSKLIATADGMGSREVEVWRLP